MQSMSCPLCAASLRERDGRLSCEHCRGSLVADTDLVAALRELDAGDAAVEAVNHRPSDAMCPRCGGAMTTCVLRIGRLELEGRHLRCASDGSFVAANVLVGTLARATHSASTAGRTFGGFWGDVGGGMQSVGEAFAQGNTPSVIFGRTRRPGPRVREVFASAFLGRTLACPRCPESALELWGDRWRCARCSGAFLENVALAAMLFDLTGTSWDPPAPQGEAGPRTCPACTTAMWVEHEGRVEIDRCGEHGTWFDEHELEHWLLDATDPPPAATSTIGGWLRRVFRRT